MKKLHYALQVRFRQISSKLVSYTILYVYPCITFMRKVYTFFKKNVLNSTHHRTFGSLFTAVSEVRIWIVILLGDIIVLFYQRLYNILCLMLSFWVLPGFYESTFLQFLYDIFHVSVIQRSPKLVLHEIFVKIPTY